MKTAQNMSQVAGCGGAESATPKHVAGVQPGGSRLPEPAGGALPPRHVSVQLDFGSSDDPCIADEDGHDFVDDSDEDGHDLHGGHDDHNTSCHSCHAARTDSDPFTSITGMSSGRKGFLST